jgi:hypothetical protein
MVRGEKDMTLHNATSSTLLRLAVRLGLARRPKPPPGLADYLGEAAE